jgi:cytochrome b6-f complex iron-sulfur subunit
MTSRRNVLKTLFFGAIGTLGASIGGVVVLILRPNTDAEVERAGYFVAARDVPLAGAPPVEHGDGRFFLVNLAPGEGAISGQPADSPGGLLALSWRCPHLGCRLPWSANTVGCCRENFAPIIGLFDCPCHSARFTKAGVRIFGPAPRSMDTMQIDVNEKGQITVQTGKRRSGGPDNPQRAVPWTPPS